MVQNLSEIGRLPHLDVNIVKNVYKNTGAAFEIVRISISDDWMLSFTF